jgi:GDP-D-mannose dehydratase
MVQARANSTPCEASIRQRTQLKGLKEFYRMDASQGVEFARVVNQVQPQVVINLGATSVADVCKKNIDEAVHSIYMLNANILQSIKELKSLARLSPDYTGTIFETSPPFIT